MTKYSFPDAARHRRLHIIIDDFDYYNDMSVEEYTKLANDFANEPIDDKRVFGWIEGASGNIVKLRHRIIPSLRSSKYDFIMYNEDTNRIASMYPVDKMPLNDDILANYVRLPVDDVSPVNLESLLKKY